LGKVDPSFEPLDRSEDRMEEKEEPDEEEAKDGVERWFLSGGV
jgi:hypothetical protein